MPYKSINKMAEIRTTIYSSELQKLIFPENSFYKKSIGEAGVADTTEQVEKPVQTAISKAKEGAPKSLPLSVETSTDKTKKYNTTLIYCQPLLIDSQSELLVNYNKRNSKQEQQAGDQYKSRGLHDGTLVSDSENQYSENIRKCPSFKYHGIYLAKEGPDKRRPSEGVKPDDAHGCVRYGGKLVWNGNGRYVYGPAGDPGFRGL